MFHVHIRKWINMIAKSLLKRQIAQDLFEKNHYSVNLDLPGSAWKYISNFSGTLMYFYYRRRKLMNNKKDLWYMELMRKNCTHDKNSFTECIAIIWRQDFFPTKPQNQWECFKHRVLWTLCYMKYSFIQ